MNIFDAYLKKYGQLIIVILGLPCTNKSELAKELIIDLNIPIININNYLKQNSFIEKTISDVKFKLYEHPDNYDWEKLNLDVNNVKDKGIVLYGNYLDINKVDFNMDLVYFINMNTNLCKQILIEKKMLPYETDDDKVKIYFNDIFNPIYEEIKKSIKINKFFNIKENTSFDEIYDELFDNIMSLINKSLK